MDKRIELRRIILDSIEKFESGKMLAGSGGEDVTAEFVETLKSEVALLEEMLTLDGVPF